MYGIWIVRFRLKPEEVDCNRLPLLPETVTQEPVFKRPSMRVAVRSGGMVLE